MSSTCDFPEFTGRICPALCEKSCVLKLSCDQPVTIRENEAAIVEAAFREGYIQVKTPERNGKKVAVIGAGPAGLVVANQLNLKGYSVTLFDKDEAPGGLLRFGIPNFKLDKNVIDSIPALALNHGFKAFKGAPILHGALGNLPALFHIPPACHVHNTRPSVYDCHVHKRDRQHWHKDPVHKYRG